MSPTATPIRRLLALWLGVLMVLPLAGKPGQPTTMAEVIVRGDSVAAVTDAVEAVGGVVHRSFQVIAGVDATVPASQVHRLRADGDVIAVTPDARVELHGNDNYDPRDDPSSLRSVISSIEADKLWERDLTGAGIGVALIDTGVVPVDGLNNDGQVFHGPDLSFESQNDSTRYLDTFGHGTHMASIIAGRDAGVDPRQHKDHPTAFLGVAPEAHLISLKVADAFGATDVSQVIAAIDWVVQHRNDPGMNIRVMNLSFGVHSDQDYTVDPVAHAAQVAWDSGIVVVTAAGNDGDVRAGVTSPAYHPRLIAVGAVDTNESRKEKDWTPLSFSARTGPDGRAPDILTAGSSLVGLAAPGSYLDVTFGETARVGDRYFKGTGTSQAAAVTSGAIALMVQANPNWTPDQIKAQLLAKSVRLSERQGFVAETGTLGLQLRGVKADKSPPRDRDLQEVTPSTGGGSLEAARGGNNLVMDGVPLEGEVDIHGMAFDSAVHATAEEAEAAWNGTQWNGTTWTGTQWNGTQWNGTQWNGTTWTGTQWSGTQWSGTQWSGTTWTGTQWSGTQWSGTQWSGTQWSGTQWSGTQWSGTQWSGTVWG